MTTTTFKRKLKLGDVVWLPESHSMTWYHEDPRARFVVVEIYCQPKDKIKPGAECAKLLTFDERHPRFSNGNAVFAENCEVDKFMTATRRALLSGAAQPIEKEESPDEKTIIPAN